MSRRNRKEVQIGNPTRLDDLGLDQRYAITKCALYMQRLVSRYPDLCWLGRGIMTWILGPAIETLTGFAAEAPDSTRLPEIWGSSGSYYDLDELEKKKSNGKAALVRAQVSARFAALAEELLELRISSLRYRGQSTIERNLASVSKMFNLTEKETELCFWVYLISVWDKPHEYFCDTLECEKRSGNVYLQAAIRAGPSELSRMLRKLRRIGLLASDRPNYAPDIQFEDGFLELFEERPENVLSRKLFRKAPNRVLPLHYHSLDREQAEHVLALLEKRPAGSSTHVLIYGLPGSGKTCFAQAVARRIGIPAYEIISGEENNSRLRRGAITACLNMTSCEGGSLVIVDEADNVLNTGNSWSRRGETQDKGWLNELLERPGVRMIWITNRIDDIEESVLRRFAFSLHFRPFGRRERFRLFERVLRRHGVKRLVSCEETARLSREYELSAGAIDLAVKKARDLSATDAAGFQRALKLSLEAHRTLLNGGVPVVNRDRPGKVFVMEGLNLTANLPHLFEQLQAFDRFLRKGDRQERKNMNLLFHGPPGTGKSELARHIGERLDREVLVKRASDILNPYVGMTERYLAEAFHQAESQGSILLIDEADSVLYSRSAAVRSWEVSFTNEFLTQMERFRGILICTTNRLDGLDTASIRRFNHKIGFDYLTAEGNRIFYDRLLAPLSASAIDPITSQRLSDLTHLAPGDFKVVKDRFAFLPQSEISPSALVEALAEEAEIKIRQQGRRVVGFAAA